MFSGLGWTYPCDIWSVGCILVELCSVCDTYPVSRALNILLPVISLGCDPWVSKYSGQYCLCNFMSLFHSLFVLPFLCYTTNAISLDVHIFSQLLLVVLMILQGDALFQTHENLEHLAMMERVLGPIPIHMIKKAEYVLFFKVKIIHLSWERMGSTPVVFNFVYIRRFRMDSMLTVIVAYLGSRRLEKYFRHGRELNWPEGAVSRESIRAVRRLPRLRVRSLTFAFVRCRLGIFYHLPVLLCLST